MKKKALARGYTTGTCAQAAAKGAALMFLSGAQVEQVSLELPNGERKTLAVRDITMKEDSVRCGVKKYSGDDPDITDGVMVYVTVSRKETRGITLDGGRGIGRVTKPGLSQAIGEAAINKVPRSMILREVAEACEYYEYTKGLSVLVEIPEGEALAKKTFNPRIGIEGGLSVLGTSGIVEPMSERALIDTIQVEMKVKIADRGPYILAAPGNYGLDFLREHWGIAPEEVVKCSNYVGETIDFARDLGAKGILFIAHIGKFIKVAGGIMNTHSRYADCRMELLACAALRAGLSGEKASELLKANTTDDALSRLNEGERAAVMAQVMEAADVHLNQRAGADLKAGAIVFSGVYGLLGSTESARALMEERKRK